MFTPSIQASQPKLALQGNCAKSDPGCSLSAGPGSGLHDDGRISNINPCS